MPEVQIIPHESLRKETLFALVEEFVSRSGTDYGFAERSLKQKSRDVLRQLEAGDLLIVFDVESESCNIIAASDADFVPVTDRD